MKINLNHLKQLLKNRGFKLVVEKDKIFIDSRTTENVPLENYKGVMPIDGVWSYFQYLSERREPIVQVIKQFTNKEDAIKYLFLKELHNFFIFEYVVPSRNRDIKEWSFDIILEEMQRLRIPHNYLSYNDHLYSNSILFEKKDEKWFSGYLNYDSEVVFKTKNGNDDENWFLSLFANDVYVLYLFDQYIGKLNESQMNIGEVTDQDRLIILDFK